MCTETPFSCARQRSLMWLAVLQLRHGRRSDDADPELAAVDGSDPPVRGPGTGSGPGVFAHSCPRPPGVAPDQQSLAGRPQCAARQGGEAPTRRSPPERGRRGVRRGAEPPLASPCRGPAKRGPKGYAGLRALDAADKLVRRSCGRTEARRKSGGPPVLNTPTVEREPLQLFGAERPTRRRPPAPWLSAPASSRGSA